MPEGFEVDQVPTRRGRKDPELQQRLLNDNPLDDQGDDQDETGSVVYEGLSQGAMLISKFTRELEIPGGHGERIWSTYGATDHVLPGESTDDAYERLVRHTVQGLYSQTTTMVGVIEEEAEERRQEQRARRIQPARSGD